MTSRRSIWGRLRHWLICRRPTAGFLREPSLANLLLYLRPLRSQLAGVVAISLAATVVTLITPLALRSAIDSLQPTVQMAQLVRWVVLLIGLAATAAVLHAVARVSTADISRQFEYRLRQDLFDTLQALPARTLRRYGVGDLISRVMSDVGTVRAILGPATTYPWTTTVTTVVAA